MGCPAGVLLAAGGGGPDTGVAPLLRLPDPHAAERDQKDEPIREVEQTVRGRSHPLSLFLAPHPGREARGYDCPPEVVASPSAIKVPGLSKMAGYSFICGKPHDVASSPV